MTGETLGVYVNATFFNKTIGYRVPYNTPVEEIYMDLTSKNQIMVDVSRFTVDSLVQTFHDAGHLRLLLN